MKYFILFRHIPPLFTLAVLTISLLSCLILSELNLVLCVKNNLSFKFQLNLSERLNVRSSFVYCNCLYLTVQCKLMDNHN